MSFTPKQKQFLQTANESDKESQTDLEPKAESLSEEESFNMKNVDFLWQTYYPRTFAYFYKRLEIRQDVEDLTSLTMTSFIESVIDPAKNVTKPDIYLWRVAHNQLVDFFRHKSKNLIKVTFDQEWEFADKSMEIHRSKSYKNRLQNLHICLEKNLNDQDLEMVKMQLIDDLKSPIIAVKFGLSPENVRQRISRSLKKVKVACLDIWKNYQTQN